MGAQASQAHCTAVGGRGEGEGEGLCEGVGEPLGVGEGEREGLGERVRGALGVGVRVVCEGLALAPQGSSGGSEGQGRPPRSGVEGGGGGGMGEALRPGGLPSTSCTLSPNAAPGACSKGLSTSTKSVAPCGYLSVSEEARCGSRPGAMAAQLAAPPPLSSLLLTSSGEARSSDPSAAPCRPV